MRAVWQEVYRHELALAETSVASALFGPRLTNLAVYLKAKLPGYYSGVRDFLEDVVGVNVSCGYLAKLLRKAAKPLSNRWKNS